MNSNNPNKQSEIVLHAQLEISDALSQDTQEHLQELQEDARLFVAIYRTGADSLCQSAGRKPAAERVSAGNGEKLLLSGRKPVPSVPADSGHLEPFWHLDSLRTRQF